MDIRGSKETSKITVNGDLIENVSSFEYLGSLIDDGGDCIKEVKRRLSMALKKLTDMKHLWSSVNYKLKLRVLKCCIFPIAMYGCEAWTMSKNIADRLNAFEAKCYRRILNNE